MKNMLYTSEQFVDGLEKKRGPAADPMMDQEAQRATVKDIAKGFCSPMMTRSDVDSLHGKGRWRPIKRFTIKQGAKYRCIDDGRYSGHNRASITTDRVHTVSFDMLAAVIAKVHTGFPSGSNQARPDIQAAVDDESAAFRQKPTSTKDERFLIAAFWCMKKKRVMYTLIHGHTSGLGASVNNYNRCPELQCAVLRQTAGVLAFHYYDDNIVIDTAWSGEAPRRSHMHRSNASELN